MLEKKRERPVGILHLPEEVASRGLQRFLPSEDLADFVEHYWAVEWETTEPVVRETIPHPSVHMVIEPQRTMVHGVHTQRFKRVLEGKGRALGTKFSPGGFRPFFCKSVSDLSERVLALDSIFGQTAQQLEIQATACTHAMDAFDLVESFLREFLPQSSDELTLSKTACTKIANDRSITRVEQLVEPLGGQHPQAATSFSRICGCQSQVGNSPLPTP